QQMLARLAELDLVAAEAAHASYLAAIDTPEEAEKGRTYQRMGRSLRQSLALHERFDRSAAREAREEAQEARRAAMLEPPPEEEPRRRFPRDIDAANRRASDLRTAVRRVIWTEGFEKSELESEQQLEGELYRRLEDWLIDERCEDAFVSRDLDEHVADICAEMDLDPKNVARWRDLPDPGVEVLKSWLEDLKGYAEPPWKASG
ncbi:hypothetical protein, partial [Phenylobacterium sp.]|uniref:hypothetical protein n=1 Tax=Phenylobacterium sp. TaxID=1871053 RepID=UPI0025ED9E03